MRGKGLRAAAVLATAIVTTSCGHGSATRSGGAPPPLGPVPVITSIDQITRPIDSYEVTVAQTRTLFQAATVVTQQCVRSYSLSYPAPQWDDAFSDTPQQLKERSVVYGFFDPSASPGKGYDAVGVEAAGAEPVLSDAQYTVLDGVDRATNKPVAAYDGKSVPAHGCLGKGRAEIGAAPMPADSGPLPDGGPTVPADDPRMVDVNAKWSACMKSRGFDYASPWAAYLDPKWRTRPKGSTTAPQLHTPLEVATAAADLACKQSTNLIGVAVAVETAYDDQYIRSHAAALALFKQQLDARLRKAEQVITAAQAAPR
ncbi:hypothetical protein [Streptacidiphilus cavernicola]|uniref:Uncharacterized protein n=1 Tax=Streptacidiphilus cavernicola TaxID=3342716 RepID=A0ABV6W5R4_9ACTN